MISQSMDQDLNYNTHNPPTTAGSTMNVRKQNSSFEVRNNEVEKQPTRLPIFSKFKDLSM
tara:strand:+ start:678 stop:857 length:180 start_codon:yes stop_codon:yes gene_type:complete